MAQGPESRRKSEVNRALRQARRLYRLADTKGEVLERVLDRLIKRKTRVLGEEAEQVIKPWEAYSAAVSQVERGLVDVLGVARY